MPQSRHNVLMNAFRPAQEVDNPRFFAGRAKQVSELTDALHVVGSTPLIFGDRGLGKTSLAIQMKHIAEGEIELLGALGLRDRAFSEDQRCHALLVTCTDETRNFDGLIQRLINAAEKVDLSSKKPIYKPRHVAKRTTSFTVWLKFISKTDTTEFIPKEARPSYQDFSPTEKLQYLIDCIAETSRQPVVFIIDEIDLLEDTRGLASFIKATSGKRAKFVLVGIASDFGNLLADHQSIGRSLVGVRVPLMDQEELHQIIDNAQDYLNYYNIPITFGYSARAHIVRSAEGFPWLAHVIGEASLLKASAAGHDEVTGNDVLDAIYELPSNRFGQQFSDTYSRIVRASPQRETVLRAFADWFSDDIPTTEIYRVLKADLGVANPSSYKAELASPKFGPVIYTPVGRRRGDVRFADPIFKVYIRLTPSIHKGVDRRVRSAFASAAVQPHS